MGVMSGNPNIMGMNSAFYLCNLFYFAFYCFTMWLSKSLITLTVILHFFLLVG